MGISSRRTGLVQFPYDLLAKTEHRTLAGQRNQPHFPGLSRLETHGGSRSDVEPHATRPVAIKGKAGMASKKW